jgi:hypothetical protein
MQGYLTTHSLRAECDCAINTFDPSAVRQADEANDTGAVHAPKNAFCILNESFVVMPAHHPSSLFPNVRFVALRTMPSSETPDESSAQECPG